MVDVDSILNYLSENKDRLQKDYHLTKIGVFGSMARQEQTEKSDIDLIVEFEPNTPDLNSLKCQLKQEIQNKFNRSVDLCRLKYVKPIFKSLIQTEVRYV